MDHALPPPIDRDAPGYPPALLALPDPPTRVWLRGQIPGGRMVAVVGARAATGGALREAGDLGRLLAERGLAVVSGGALGIDGAAHLGCLDGGGRTVVVLGTGIDVCYPARHRRLFDRILVGGGAIVTPFPPGSQPCPWAFPRRNPLISALGGLCVVVEAGARSGSLHTARATARLGRPVIARLGSPGCDQLASSGAAAARSLEEILTLVAGQAPAPPRAPTRPDLRRLYDALEDRPLPLDELARRADLDAAAAMALAVRLELEGLALRAAGGRYRRLLNVL